MEDQLSVRTWALGAVVLLAGYVALGYTVQPLLLAPLGCEASNHAVGYAPAASFDIAYDQQGDSLTVTHTGGDPIPANRVEALEIRITEGGETNGTVHTWAGAGGTFPVGDGDSITLRGAAAGGRLVADGDTVRVVWRGTWPDPQPDYCPYNGATTGSSTLAKSTF